jgi:hypothetical protein
MKNDDRKTLIRFAVELAKDCLFFALFFALAILIYFLL